MNTPNQQDFAYKKKKIREFMVQEGYDAVLLARRDNFAWFSFGGDNKIFYSMDVGYGLLAITQQDVFLIAQTMDIDRIYDDELKGLEIEKKAIRWYQETREQTALRLLKGKRIAADIPLDGTQFKQDEIFALHLPYTQWEVERYREVGRMTDVLMKTVAEQIEPGMTEQEAASILLYEYGKQFSVPKVLLVGSDERIGKYRHPVPSNKKIEKTVLLHAAADIHGMHSNITRMFSFGKPTEELEERYNVLNQALASACALLIPGEKPREILERRKQIFAEHGLEVEYGNHYPGAVTGYWFGSAEPILQNKPIMDTQCFDWFITITGAKVEELVMATPKGGEVLSASGVWPLQTYCEKGFCVELPKILER